MKKFISLLIVLSLFVLFPVLNANAATNIKNISDYEINAVVNEDRSCDFTETITVNFISQGHGIYRTIPISFDSRIYNISVEGDKYEFSYEDGYAAIKIGDPDSYVSGTKTYVIKYSLTTSEIDNKPNVAYLNLIGTDWEADILKAKITLSMPAPANDIQAYVGYHGAISGGERLDIKKDGNTITLNLKDKLSAKEGITILAGLPAGTFHDRKPTLELTMLSISFAFLALIVVMFFAFGKDKRLTSVVGFYPPDDINPAEAGYLIDQMIDRNDITSLIYYWASHGHMHIVEQGKDNFQLVKVSQLDNKHKQYEIDAFEKLFSYGHDGKVDLSALTYNYYKTVEMVKIKVMSSFTGERKLVNKGYAMLSSILTAVLFFILGSLCWGRINPSPVMFIIGAITAIPSFFLTGYMWYISMNVFKFNKLSLFINSIAYALIGIIISVILAFVGSFAAMNFFYLFLPFAVGAVSCAIVPFITRRTDYYDKTLEKLIGFKDFILTAEKDRLETMLKDNPTYYYDVLPFAQVLGVSNIWADKFKDITMEPPSWYQGYNGYFNIWLFSSSLHAFNNSVSKTAFSPPQSSGSASFGGGGGGGFSGGGFGGGGGGSW